MTSCQQVSADKPIDVLEKPARGEGQNAVYSDNAQNLFGYYLRALYAETNEDVKSAAKFYTESLAIDKTNPELLQASFSNLYAAGRIIAAAEIAQQAESLNQNLRMGIEPALAIAARDADWEAVLALSESAIIEGSSQHLGFLFRAWAMYNLGQNSAAINVLESLSKLLDEQGYSSSNFINVFIAQLYILKNDYPLALTQLAEISLDKTSNQELIIATAEAYALAGKLNIARKLAQNLSVNYNQEEVRSWLEQRFNAKSPQNYENYFLAQSIVHLSLFTLTEEAISYLGHRSQLGLFIANSNGFALPAASFILLQLADQQNDFQGTNFYFSSIPEANPHFQISLVLYLYQLRKHRETADAIKLLQTYLAEKTNSPILEEMLADFYRIEKECRNAIVRYENVAREKPGLADIHRKLGMCYEQTDQPHKAEAAFAKALELNPNDSGALNYLGYWWADEGRNLEEAIELITRAVELHPDNGYYADSLGWVYFKIGEADKAVIWLEHAIQLAPDDAVIHDHLGDVYWHLGRPLEARYKWQFAHEMYSNEATRKVVSEKIKFGLPPALD
ncbi:MAG: tetratricopeptide repeat protein [Alphaproteobacteria bacterium]|nr:tetratricopeptide repeat protein [Alphaproteobacteria bacterium]